jgi:hypothetical protein
LVPPQWVVHFACQLEREQLVVSLHCAVGVDQLVPVAAWCFLLVTAVALLPAGQ